MKTVFLHMSKTQTRASSAVSVQLIIDFVSIMQIVQSFFLHVIIQASSIILNDCTEDRVSHDVTEMAVILCTFHQR